MAPDLRGRVAVVTGANRGIGFEVCRQLGRLGLRVILGSRDAARGEKAASILQSEGLDVVCLQLDVTDRQSVDAVAAWLKGEHGRLDVLVNNAGVFMPNSNRFTETTLEEAEAIWQVNVTGAWLTTMALLPLIRRNGWGRIVNVSSEGGSLQHMNGDSAAYRVSKAALNAFTRVLAHDVPPGILVNAVCPGWVASDMGGPRATRSLEQGAASILWAVTLDDDGPTGGFYRDGRPLPW